MPKRKSIGAISASANGCRWRSYSKDPASRRSISTHDVLTKFRFKLTGEREGTAFHRIMRPQGVALPILGCAVWVKLNTDCTAFADARISIAPVAPTPILAVDAANALIGQPVSAETIDKAVEAAHGSLKPRTSKYRATGEYRQHMIGTLLRKTLRLAVERARTGVARAEGVGMG